LTRELRLGKETAAQPAVGLIRAVSIYGDHVRLAARYISQAGMAAERNEDVPSERSGTV
jgi:hypothetical protein